jgi:hypothetical protein
MEGEVKKMRGLFCAVVVALVASGCGKALEPQVSGGGFKLYEAASTRTSQLVAVIDTKSHSVDRTLPWGILAGNHLYSMTSDNTLADINPETGSATRTLRLAGAFALANGALNGIPGGLSQNGRWLVLERPRGATGVASQMVVVDTSSMKAAAPIDLAGIFDFDAISNDGHRIYMIEYLAGANYRVRLFDVASAQLDPNVVVDKTDGAADMTGIRVSGIASPDGQWLYSVYARPNSGAFIHALNLTGPYAFCLDLPGSGYQSSSDEFQWSLAMNTDGTRIYATNGAKGIIAEVHSEPSGPAPTVVRIEHVNTSAASWNPLVRDVEAKELATGGAVLSKDGKTLVMTGKTGLVWVDTSTLRARSRHLAGWTVWSVGLSPDGSMVYALNSAATIAELSMANPGTPTTFGATGATPMALIRVDSPPSP